MGLSPGRRQAIIWTNAGILLIGPLGTNFSEVLIEIHIFSFKKMRLKVSSAKWRPFCFGLNVLKTLITYDKLSSRLYVHITLRQDVTWFMKLLYVHITPSISLLFYECVKAWFVWIWNLSCTTSLGWRHMRVIASHFASNSYLFNILVRLTTKIKIKLPITGLARGMWEVFPCHDVM